jgi:hypothetical protein
MRLPQFLIRSLEAPALDLVAGAIKYAARGGPGVLQTLSHARILGALPRK